MPLASRYVAYWALPTWWAAKNFAPHCSVNVETGMIAASPTSPRIIIGFFTTTFQSARCAGGTWGRAPPRVTRSHSGTHASAISASPMNDARQPSQAPMPIAIGGASAEPTDMPANSRAMPRARSAGGSTACTVCAPAGSDGASTAPSASRSPRNERKPIASECAAAHTDHATTPHNRARRAPSRSHQRAASGPASRYMTENAEPSQAYCVFVRCRSAVIVGASAESAWRSRYDSVIAAVAASVMVQPRRVMTTAAPRSSAPA